MGVQQMGFHLMAPVSLSLHLGFLHILCFPPENRKVCGVLVTLSWP